MEFEPQEDRSILRHRQKVNLDAVRNREVHLNVTDILREEPQAMLLILLINYVY